VTTAGAHPAFVLQVERGRTEFRSRPVDVPEFLIGAAADCQLRLGGNSIPPRHSRIVVAEGTARIEILADAPPLSVNGSVVREAVLSEGDEVEIGSFAFVIRRESPAANNAVSENPSAGANDLEAESFDPEELKGLSALELVDRIEREQEMVDEFESRRQHGAAALLHAVRERMQQRTEVAKVSDDVLLPMPQHAPELADEESLSEGLQQLLVQLTELSQALEQRSERLSRREAGYADAVSLLFDAQEKLALQLEFLAGRLSGIRQQQPEAEPTRAIA